MSYSIIPPQGNAVPIMISVPHCGVVFPDELKDQYDSNLVQSPDDTDWFVDTLYDFAPVMGMTMISAHYSRWVIDLNRDPQSKPLYTDGRIITALCPSTTFLGEPLYKDKRAEVEQTEVDRRVKEYYEPYHNKIEELLQNLQTKFGKVLLWDCHSIRQYVHTIQNEKFPDLILGDADGSSASSTLIDASYNTLKESNYSVNHNHPFKGGYITRHFGNPNQNRHALQLEMSKVNYMDDSETKYDSEKAERIRILLRKVFQNLIEQLK